ncbi:HK97-gp10 family putative phage morphogenesis protein [Cyclobacterium plantarum]|uniref:Phage protein, HK97 gp10 family n=1 Tax=Cyclobacterium plantarum TaxID=2716263 RepID=A0ABX0H8L2_9BACT|nr:HK97-gp10 family putative phage morphogenesis protein [Cyclobacterium plantarum]NHE57957.1 hypothetical protein [Cyclobacterium plantarum]
MANITFNVESTDLLRRLRRLNADVEKQVIRKAVRKGANAIKREAKKNVPVDSGNMKKRIIIRTAKRTGGTMAFVRVDSPAHHLIELGTEDREPKKAKVLAFMGSSGNMVYVKKVKGVTPNPFLGKAFESKKSNAIDAFNTELRKFINQNSL